MKTEHLRNDHSLPYSPQSQTESYTYSVASQLLTKTGSNDGWAWNGAYNLDNAYGVNGLNEQTSVGAAALTSDAKGNLAGDSVLGYAYDDTGNALYYVSNGSGQMYDAAGRLYAVGAGYATRFAYDGDLAIAEYNTSGGVMHKLTKRHVPKIRICASNMLPSDGKA